MRQSSSTFRWLVILTSCFLWLSPDLASAQDTSGLSPEVIAAAERGRVLFDEGRYQEAIDYLEEAYETHGEAIFFQYIGRCYQEIEEYCRAAQNYRRFLRESDPPEAVRSQVQERLIELDDLCEADPVDPRDDPPRRDDDPEDTGPPRHFGDDGEPRVTEDAGRGLRIAGAVMMGIGGAGVALGGILWGVAVSEAGDHPQLDEDAAGYNYDVAFPIYEEHVRPTAVGGDVAFGIGVGVLAVGLILYLVGRQRSNAAALRQAPSLALSETLYGAPLSF